MRLRALAGAGAVLFALAACEPEDPLAQQRRDCAREGGEVAARIIACTELLESGELGEAERSAALGNRGAAKQENGDVTGALRDFETALSLDPDNPRALLGRSVILVDSGQLDAAEALLQRAVEHDQSGQAHLLLGRITFQRGAYPEAVTHLDQALAQDAQSAEAMTWRARARQRQGDLEGARTDFDAAVRFDGTYALARAGRCWLNLIEERDLEQARNDAEAAAAADPRLVEGQLCRGILQLRGGEWAYAQASFEAALEVEPGSPVALFGRGVARRRSGDRRGLQDMNLARDFDRHIGETFDEWGVVTY